MVWGLLTAAFVTGLALGCTELWLRHSPPTLAIDPRLLDMEREQANCHRPSLTVAYEPVPGTCERDSSGFLDMPGERLTPDSVRIFLVGDSVSVVNRLWIQALESRLEFRTGRHAVIFNAGVGGYDICQEAWTMHEQALSARPALLLQEVTWNDLAGSTVLYRKDARTFVLMRNARVWELPSLLLRSKLAMWLALRWHFYEQASLNAKAPLSRLDTTYRCVEMLRDDSAAWKLPFVAIHFPVLGPREAFPGPAGDEARLKELYERAGVRTLHLRALLEGRTSLETLRDHPQDLLHVGGDASWMVGEVVADQLVNQGVVTRLK